MPSNGTRPACRTKCNSIFGVDLPVMDWTKEEGIADEEVRERILKAVEARAAARAAEYGPEVTRYVEKAILLQTLDHQLARAHRQSGPPAPVCGPARLWPARSR